VQGLRQCYAKELSLANLLKPKNSFLLIYISIFSTIGKWRLLIYLK